MISLPMVGCAGLIVLGSIMVSSKSVDIFGKLIGIGVIIVGAIAFFAQL